jgi:tetratricopeptide (TPR) repeat protein
MWLWLWIAVLSGTEAYAAKDSAALPLPAEAVGARSDAEARLLWKEALRLHQEERWHDTVRTLRRFISRYISAPEALEAHRLLGHALLREGLSKEALPPLQHYVEATGLRPEGLKARTTLAEAYLAAGRPTEALQLALEIEAEDSRRKLEPELAALGRLMQTRSRVARSQLTEAEQAYSQALARLKDQPSLLRTHAERAGLELQLLRCRMLPGDAASHLNELQYQEALTHRGDCLGDAIGRYRKVLEASTQESDADRDHVLSATQSLQKGWQDFRWACLNPTSAGGKRSKEEARRYSGELKTLLVQSCVASFSRNLTLLDSLKGDIPASRKAPFEQAQSSCRKFGRF